MDADRKLFLPHQQRRDFRRGKLRLQRVRTQGHGSRPRRGNLPQWEVGLSCPSSGTGRRRANYFLADRREARESGRRGLAFIYYYTKLNRQAPAERDMQVYFQVTPPAVHDMIVKLEKHGFISREPGVPRSIRLLLKRDELPDLE